MAETKVVLNLQTRGNAQRETRDIARNMGEASKSAEKYRREMDRGGRGQAGAPAAGGGGIGGLGRLGLASMGLSALQTVTNQFARMSSVLQNTLTFEDQRNRKIAESIPIIGGLAASLYSFVDELSGSANKMRITALEHQRAMAGIAARQEGVSEKIQRGSPVRRAQARAAAGRLEPGVRRLLAQAPDVMNVRAFERFEALLPGQIRGEEIGLDLTGAQGLRAGFDQDIADTRKRIEASKQTRDNARFRAENAGELFDQQQRRRLRGLDPATQALSELFGRASRPGDVKQFRQSAVLDAKEAQKKLEQEITNLKTLQVQKAENENRILELQNQKRQNAVQLAQTQLQIVKQQESRLRSQAAAFGGATEGQRELALRFAQQAKTQGFASLVPAQRNLLQRFAPEFVQRGLEGLGEADPRTKQFRELIGQEGPSTLKEALREKVRLQQEININIATNTDEMTEKLAEKLKKQFDEIAVTIDKTVAARIAGANINQLEGRANQ